MVFQSESGKAFIELAIILSLIVLLPSTVFEYSRLYTTIQEVSLLSREAANEIFRECLSYPQTAIGAPPGQTVSTCLGPQVGPGRRKAEQFFANAQTIFPEAQFRVAIYHKNSLGVVQSIASFAMPVSFASRVDTASPRFQQIIADNKRVVVAEIALPYQRLFEYSWTAPGEIYEATIF